MLNYAPRHEDVWWSEGIAQRPGQFAPEERHPVPI